MVLDKEFRIMHTMLFKKKNMKKGIVLLALSIGGVLYAQDHTTVTDSIHRDTLKLKDISYLVETSTVNDSLKVVEKTASYPNTLSMLTDRLKFISLYDQQAKAYIEVENKQDTIQVKAIYQEGEIYKGLLVEENVSNDLDIVYYEDAIPRYRYTTDHDYHYYTLLSSELDKNDSIRGQFYDLHEGSLLPLKQEYVDGQWVTTWQKDLEQQEVVINGLSTPVTLFTSLDNKKERMLWKIKDEQEVLHYIFLQREGNMILIYEQACPIVEGEEVYLNVASMINVGFDKKRVTARTNNKESISDVYFENFGKRDWKKPNQYVFDYYRRSDKKLVRARVILDKTVIVNKVFSDFVIAVANNPELFRRDVQLKDFSFEDVLSKQILRLDSSIKPTHILDEQK
ncbi:hypothetical protein HXZ78_05075 [Myroides odoratimimus]|uniref:Uncharacterized protein n=2 Tax=Flavobacteriaceae TaxID=49546 RepID=A0AAI8C711_9FLAO|nr:hypothetical protein AS202_13800 [Myroides odoratimimus]APA93190.1 hypothetical protein BK054_13350 [Myroides sp. ZB35]EKB07134.1 hypothetical protein HMPREF9711_00444 [Myroides odoratimimus CCUG 3837]MCA4792289.1 hypothetical protein [Myroides odoratimimus]MCA4806196.1 hypothetical protein [Myroides odoratimimus]